ncbi:T9SS type A sorting domain-containing protein [Rufibacter roseus]|uniref:T9SS type A sorting domain-containing protein n=2 Tax=Rufibacter roseus TaxID=1567108 RepID=A0ABW2DMG8_9BACT
MATLPCYSQNLIMRIIVEDAIGQKDSVSLGIHDQSTLGMNSELGESNIFGEPFDDLDIRVIQRERTSMSCVNKGIFGSNGEITGEWFPTNTDSKIDLRPFVSFDSFSGFFEIIIKAKNYPLTVSGYYSEMNNGHLASYSSVYLMSSDCGNYGSNGLRYDSKKSVLFTLPDNSRPTLVAHFTHEVGIKESKEESAAISLYPNPTTGRLKIISNIGKLKKPSLTIFDMLGRQVLTGVIESNNDVDLSQLLPGNYLIEITEGRNVIRRRFVKI